MMVISVRESDLPLGGHRFPLFYGTAVVGTVQNETEQGSSSENRFFSFGNATVATGMPDPVALFLASAEEVFLEAHSLLRRAGEHLDHTEALQRRVEEMASEIQHQRDYLEFMLNEPVFFGDRSNEIEVAADVEEEVGHTPLIYLGVGEATED